MASGGRFVARNLDVVADSVRVTSRTGARGVGALPRSLTRGFDSTAGFAPRKVDNFDGVMRRGDGVTDASGSSSRLAGGSCPIGNSFVPGTEVLMADGTTKPIEDIELGNRVWATDPETGEEGPREVTRLIEGYGTKTLVDIEIDGDVVTATDGHPIWVNQRGEWIDADEVQAGDLLLTPEGVTVAVDDVEVRVVVDQTVHNLTVDGIHTYYVTAGNQQVLTHNAGCETVGTTAGNAQELRRNMALEGRPVGDGEAAAHIVASTGSTLQWASAAESRALLSRYGVGVNDAANGVALGHPVPHNFTHRRTFHDGVYQRLSAVERTMLEAGRGHNAVRSALRGELRQIGREVSRNPGGAIWG